MEKAINDAPSTSGVYFFFKGKDTIYIGKSVNIRARLRSHVENAKIDRKESLIVHNADRIGYIVTDSEFKAILLESALINKHQPKYNIRWKDDKSNLYLTITKGDEYPKVILARKTEIDNRRSLSFGPFSSARDAETLVREIRKVVPFCTQRKISKHPCFYSKIHLCDPCPNAVAGIANNDVKTKLKRLYRQNLRNVVSLLSNKQEILLSRFYKEVTRLKKKEKYEEALVLRDRILRLEHLLYKKSFTKFRDDLLNQLTTYNPNNELQDFMKTYFNQTKTVSRIECYDISNLQLKEPTGSMVVYQDGFFDRSQYRRFAIKIADSYSDFEMLAHVIERRFKHSWRKPDLILIDGGKPQLRFLAQLLKEYAVVGIAKHPDRLVIGVGSLPKVRLPNNSNVLNLFRSIRDESHRFAKKYHLFLRGKKLI